MEVRAWEASGGFVHLLAALGGFVHLVQIRGSIIRIINLTRTVSDLRLDFVRNSMRPAVTKNFVSEPFSLFFLKKTELKGVHCAFQTS